MSDFVTKEEVAEALTASGSPTTPDQVSDEQLQEFAKELGMEASVSVPPDNQLPPADQPDNQLPPVDQPPVPPPKVWTADELKDPQGDQNHPLHAVWVKEQQEKMELRRRVEELEAKNNPLHDKEINDPETQTFGAITLEEATLQGGEVMNEYMAARDTFRDGLRAEEGKKVAQQQASESEQRAALDRAIEEYKVKIPDANPDAVIRRHGKTLLDGTPNPNFRALSWEEGHAVNEIEAAGGLVAFKQKLREEGARVATNQPPDGLANPPLQSFTNGMGNAPNVPNPGVNLPKTVQEIANELAKGRVFSYQEIQDIERSNPEIAAALR